MHLDEIHTIRYLPEKMGGGRYPNVTFAFGGNSNRLDRGTSGSSQ